MPGYTQLCNRVGAHPSYWYTICTVFVVLVVAAGATYVRGQVLEKELVARITQSSAQIDSTAQSANASLDMSQVAPLPAADLAANNDADKKVIADEADLDRHGGWATFIILAFIFVFLQLLGVIFGYRWGFAGQNSAEAYRDIGGGRYSSYAAVREAYRRVADTAQSRLAALQQRIMIRNSETGTSGQHLSKTFRDYMQETRLADEADRQNEMRHARAIKTQQESHVPPAAPTPARTPATGSCDDILAQLDALGEDKQAKLDLLAALPDPLHAEVMVALKQRKEDEAKKARNAAAEALL